jgi:hypothetical protein
MCLLIPRNRTLNSHEKLSPLSLYGDLGLRAHHLARVTVTTVTCRGRLIAGSRSLVPGDWLLVTSDESLRDP